METGLDRLLADDALRARLLTGRLGLLAHPASVDRTLTHAAAALRAKGARFAIIFGPEHGYGGEAQDMIGVGDARDRDGTPIRSLYGETEDALVPASEDLGRIDTLVVDLQDVGSRYYTFVWTALLMARACAAKGVEVIVCDRPNPLGGVITEGAPQLAAERSFVGLRSVPVRHALTVGELVRDAARDEGLTNVTVIEMEGWRRAMRWRDTGLPWVLPSPNMPTDETATVYPGGCLLEGTNLSEGRGTTRPFELLGAPWVDALALAKALREHAHEGCHPRVTTFRPMFQKHAGATCRGVQVHVTDASVFAPYRAYLALIAAARRTEGFRWRTEKYEFVDDRPAIDLLTGDGDVRRAIDAGVDFDDVMRIGEDRMKAWRETERARWIYPR